MSEPSRRVRIAAFALIAAVPLLMLAAIEGLLRYRARAHHGYGRIEDLSKVDAQLGFPTLRPGLSAGPLHSNAIGFRGPELSEPKPAGTLRFAFLGASTTFCAEVSDDAHTWPGRTIDKLRAAWPNAKLDYVNTGYPGYRLEQIRALYEARVVQLSPDVVVYYEATNELSYDTRNLARARGLSETGSESKLAKASLFYFLIETNLQLRARKAALFEPEGKLSFDPNTLTERYQRGLEDLIDSVRAHGSVPVLVTFSARMRRGMSRDELAEAAATASYYMPYLDAEGLLSGYEAYNGALRRAAQAKAALLIDGENEIPATAASYVDSVHFNDGGAEAMAERLSKRLLSAAPIQERLASAR